MKGDYPRFSPNYTREELIEHFMLSSNEQEFIAQFRGDTNRYGVAVLLKSLQYLGYFPQTLGEVATEIKLFIAKQLNLSSEKSAAYPWDSGTRGDHFTQIRQYTGFRFAKAQDKEDLSSWLRKSAAYQAITFSALFECTIERLRSLSIELPAEQELIRIVNSALNGFFVDIHHQVTQRLNNEVRASLDQLLCVGENESRTTFDSVKTPAGGVGVDNLQKEIVKLQTLRHVGITPEHLTSIPFKVQKLLFQRAKNEKASEVRSHLAEIRYGLMACFVSVRTMEVIDDIVQMFVKLIHRIDVRAENQRDKQLLADFKRVEGKTQILYRVAEVVTENPDGTIRDVIFPKVKPETFENLVAEKKASGSIYRLMHLRLMLSKYTHHYRRILRLALENLTFRSDNRFQPIIKALAIIKRYVRTSYQYFPEPVPIEGVVSSSWEEIVLQKVEKLIKVNRKAYELCVLLSLERALKCKEIWVEGSYEWRNPNLDLPSCWTDETVRTGFYQRLNQPIVANAFVKSIKQEMIDALTQFNRLMPLNDQVSIYFPGRGEKRGLFRVSKVKAQPEPHNIRFLKAEILKQYGLLDLLDLFVEAICQQYDEMIKATVAMKYGDATAEAILKRFSSINVQHPTYEALVELGKVEKTIFLCNYLPSLEQKIEVQEGLNVVENWNGANDFIFYGRRGKLSTNDPQEMEISILCLHLLQNCLTLINTILLERTIEQQGIGDKLTDEDRRALTPLFHGHINPYGMFELNLEKPSFLEVP